MRETAASSPRLVLPAVLAIFFAGTLVIFVTLIPGRKSESTGVSDMPEEARVEAPETAVDIPPATTDRGKDGNGPVPADTGTLEGTVRVPPDAEHVYRGVLNGQIVTVYNASGEEVAKLATDRKGKYTATLPAGKYTVETDLRGLECGGLERIELTIPPRGAANGDFLTGRYPKKNYFSGLVRDAVTWDPIHGAKLRVVPRETGIAAEGETDPDGRYRFLIPIEISDVYAECEGYLPFKSYVIPESGHAVNYREIRLIPKRAVKGRVIDEATGVQIKSATIRISAHGYRTTHTTDEYGEYRIETGRDKLRIECYADNYLDFGSSFSGYQFIEPGQGATVFNIRMKPFTARLRGDVTDASTGRKFVDTDEKTGKPVLGYDENGEPIFNDTRMKIYSTETNPGAVPIIRACYDDSLGWMIQKRGAFNGSFSTQLYEGTFRIVATREGYKPYVSPPIETRYEDVAYFDFALSPLSEVELCSVTISLENSASGEFMAASKHVHLSVTRYLLKDENERWVLGDFVGNYFAGDEGVFSLELEAGAYEYRVIWQAANSSPTTYGFFEIEGGENIGISAPVEILSRTAKITGICRNAHGALVNRMAISVLWDGKNIGIMGPSTDGEFEVAVPAGTITLLPSEKHAQSYSFTPLTIVVGESATENVDITVFPVWR